MSDGWFTEEELRICRETDILEVCRRLGYHVKPGHIYSTIEEIDSIRIKNKKAFIRYSNSAHGTAIDFLKEVQGMEWRDAVGWLLDFNGISHEAAETERDQRSGYSWYKVTIDEDGCVSVIKKGQIQPKYQVTETEEKKAEFILPEKTNPNRLKAYLTTQRMIDVGIVDMLLEMKLIYESDQTHNVVFVGFDKDGIPRHASMRGTYTKEGCKAYKGVATGSDARFSFNIVNDKSNCLAVFEAPIDAISFLEATYGKSEFNILALTGVHDRALEQFLSDHQNINEVMLCLDNDEAGIGACEKIIKKYTSGEWKEREIDIYRDPPIEGFKDWNEMWVDWKKSKSVASL